VLPLAPRALAHLPFYEALAALDDASNEWRALSAGLLTLRLFDRWVGEECAGRQLSRWEISGVSEAVQAVSMSTRARSILTSIVNAAEGRQSWSVALPMLAAYGRVLHFDASWALAADVYTTVVENGEQVDSEIAITAAHQGGFCLRMVGDLEGAASSYAACRAIALRTGDLGGMLRADIGVAAIATQRGNLPAAEEQLDSVIERAASGAGACVPMLSSALHNRGVISSRRGRTDDAIGFMNRALRLCTVSAERDRILSDIGAALLRSGAYDAARDAHMIVYATAQFQDARWVAGINLLELAAKTANEPAFERFRRELPAASMPPRLRAHYHMYVADGQHRFGRVDSALAELRQAIQIADEHGITEVVFDAERRLTEFQRARPEAPRVLEPYVPSEQVLEAARSIEELSRTALASV
jgi:tetratricopeptide (TPR) repeat protein